MGMKFNQNASKQRHFVEPKLAACEFTELLLQIEIVIRWSGVTLPDFSKEVAHFQSLSLGHFWLLNEVYLIYHYLIQGKGDDK